MNEDKEYLEEEYYPEAEILVNVSNEKLLVLSYLPDENQSLEHWLKTEHDLEQSLLITSQICQVFRYLHQRKWCILNFVPRFIQMGTLIQFFDLTSVYPLGEVLKCGFMGNYYAPELAYSKDPIDEKMSSYAVGALLYQIIHRQNLPTDPTKQIEINPLPFSAFRLPLSTFRSPSPSCSRPPLSPICYLLSPICYLLSPICYLLSPICYLLSAICYLLSPISYLLSPISYFLKTLTLNQKLRRS